jgi:hypothetical protein
MPCKRVFLSRGPRWGTWKGFAFRDSLREKDSISGFLFLDPEDIKILGNVIQRRKPQSTSCVSVRPWLLSDIHIWVPSFWNLRILQN